MVSRADYFPFVGSPGWGVSHQLTRTLWWLINKIICELFLPATPALCGTAGVYHLVGVCSHISSSKFILIQNEPLFKVMFRGIVFLSECLLLLEILKATLRSKTKIRISFPAPWASSLILPPSLSTQLTISEQRDIPPWEVNTTSHFKPNSFQSIFLYAFLFSQCL